MEDHQVLIKSIKSTLKIPLHNIFIVCFCSAVFLWADTYSLRQVDKPTLLNLDLALYVNNPARDPVEELPVQSIVSWDKIQYSKPNSTSTVLATSTKKPSGQEVATEVFLKKAADYYQGKELSQFIYNLESIRPKSYTGNVSLFRVPRFIVTPESVWLEFEARENVNVQGAQNLDTDKFSEIYLQVGLTGMLDTKWPQFIQGLEATYFKQELNKEQAKEWANTLSSYWYPKYNTDLEPHYGKWKLPDGKIIENVFAVFKSVPQKEAHHTIIVSPVLVPIESSQVDSNVQSVEVKVMDLESESSYLNSNIQAAQETLKKITIQDKALVSKEMKRILQVNKEMGIEGLDNWLFFKRSLEYSIASQPIHTQEAPYNPLPLLKAFEEFLNEQDIQLLVVPIPAKSMVYPENLSSKFEKINELALSEIHYQWVETLNQNGIETLDFYPALLQAKAYDKDYSEPLFQQQDSHWGWRGIVKLAEQLIPRIMEYQWYQKLEKTPSQFEIQQGSHEHFGDLVERLPKESSLKYQKMSLKHNTILKDGQPWKKQMSAPLLVIGDSFTGVYELTQPKSSGIAAHIAYGTRVPVDLVTSWGGGPNVRQRMLKAKKKYLKETRLVIYMMASRDYWNYSQMWKPAEFPQIEK